MSVRMIRAFCLVFLLVTLSFVTGLAACATVRNSMETLIGKYGDDQHGWSRSSGVIKENPQKPDVRSLANGRRLFHTECAPCHGCGGRGDGKFATSLSPPPKDLADIRGDRSDFYIYLQISLGDGAMPGHDELSESSRWDIVNYVQTLRM